MSVGKRSRRPSWPPVQEGRPLYTEDSMAVAPSAPFHGWEAEVGLGLVPQHQLIEAKTKPPLVIRRGLRR